MIVVIQQQYQPGLLRRPTDSNVVPACRPVVERQIDVLGGCSVVAQKAFERILLARPESVAYDDHVFHSRRYCPIHGLAAEVHAIAVGDRHERDVGMDDVIHPKILTVQLFSISPHATTSFAHGAGCHSVPASTRCHMP
ncbi:MAG: hypothetical protein IPK24_11150 [Kineosporiaceae bacterium]|nr:hypothetical protein [Kineosporiaceae bacterium]